MWELFSTGSPYIAHGHSLIPPSHFSCRIESGCSSIE
jgi:hypothetical protein